MPAPDADDDDRLTFLLSMRVDGNKDVMAENVRRYLVDYEAPFLMDYTEGASMATYTGTSVHGVTLTRIDDVDPGSDPGSQGD